VNLAALLERLRAASAPLDATALHEAAQRAATRATLATGGRVTYSVVRTPTGARIQGPGGELSARALRRMLGEELERARMELATQARGRLP